MSVCMCVSSSTFNSQNFLKKKEFRDAKFTIENYGEIIVF